MIKPYLLFCILFIINVQALSGKKGFVYSSNDITSSAKVASLNVSWWYNWNYQINSNYASYIPANVLYTPMIWGMNSVNNKTCWNLVNQTTITGYGNELLGFNEPDGAAQSNMTVDQAIAAWPLLMQTNRRLGSPAVASSPTSTSGWLAQFMNKAQALNYRVDFITLHWYASPNSASLLNTVDTLYSLYHLPIWITEFAVADWSAQGPALSSKYTIAQVSSFMAAVLPALDSRTYVERYSWKTRTTDDVNLWFSAIFYDNGTLTSLGEQYSAYVSVPNTTTTVTTASSTSALATPVTTTSSTSAMAATTKVITASITPALTTTPVTTTSSTSAMAATTKVITASSTSALATPVTTTSSTSAMAATTKVITASITPALTTTPVNTASSTSAMITTTTVTTVSTKTTTAGKITNGNDVTISLLSNGDATLPAIIGGGVVGFIALLFIIYAIVVYRRRLKHQKQFGSENEITKI